MSTLGRKRARSADRARAREDERLAEAAEEVREARGEVHDARDEVRALGASLGERLDRLEGALLSRLAVVEARAAQAARMASEADVRLRRVSCPFCRQALSLDASARTLDVECGCGGWSIDLGRPARPAAGEGT